MSERAKGLLAVVDRFIDTHNEWGADKENEFITEAYETACEDMILVFEGGDLPGECRKLASAVEKLAEAWERFKEDAAASNGPSRPNGGFHKLVEYLWNCRKQAEPHRRRRIEPIETLLKQGVFPKQICDIYGWMDGDVPQTWKLDEEIAKPGTHVNENFVPPYELKDREDAARRQAIIEAASKRTEAKIKNLTEPAPESWESLFRQGLSGTQIAKMKKCSVEEVNARAKELGFPEPPLNYGDPRFSPAPQEPGINEHAARSMDAGANIMRHESDPELDSDVDTDPIEEDYAPPQTLEEQVLAYHDSGLKPKVIAEQMTHDGTPVSASKVTSIIRAAEKSTSTAE